MKHFIKRLAGFSLGPFLGAAISLILFPIFTNLLAVEEYGLAGGFQTLLLLVPNFIYFGMDQAYTREYHHAEDKRNLMQSAMLLPFAFGLLFSAVVIIFAEGISQWFFGSPNYPEIIWYAALWIMMTIIERYVLLTVRMQEKAVEYSFFSALLKIGQFLVSMLLVLLGLRDFTLILYGLIFGHIAANLILFVRYRDYLDIRNFHFDGPLIKQMFLFGLPIMIATSVAVLLNAIDIVFLTEFSNPTNLGIYKAGSQVGAIIGIMKTAFASFWVPTAYRWYEEGKSLKHYKFISDILLLLLSALFFSLLLLKRPIALFLNPNGDYLDVQYIIALLAFPHIMYTLSETTTLGIVFSRKTHLNIYVSIISFLTSLLINFLLTAQWGYRGAALASTAAYAAFYLLRTYFSRRTGFYFGQSKQIIVMILMIVGGLLNMFEMNGIFIVTIILAALALFVQFSTIKQSLEIKGQPDKWDFT